MPASADLCIVYKTHTLERACCAAALPHTGWVSIPRAWTKAQGQAGCIRAQLCGVDVVYAGKSAAILTECSVRPGGNGSDVFLGSCTIVHGCAEKQCAAYSSERVRLPRQITGWWPVSLPLCSRLHCSLLSRSTYNRCQQQPAPDAGGIWILPQSTIWANSCVALIAAYVPATGTYHFQLHPAVSWRDKGYCCFQSQRTAVDPAGHQSPSLLLYLFAAGLQPHEPGVCPPVRHPG